MSETITTKHLAGAVKVLPEAIRVRLRKTGSYYGVKPIKLPNGQLRWPADAVEKLLQQGGAAQNGR